MERKIMKACESLSLDGELRWTEAPMPRWHAAMFPVRYLGDFKNFWSRVALEAFLGCEIETNMPSMELIVDRRWRNQKGGK